MSAIEPAAPVAATASGKTRPQRRRRRHAGIGTYVLLIVLFAVVMFPVYYGVIGSFMNTTDIDSYPPALWPVHGFQFANYLQALTIIPLAQEYLNSILQTLFITLGQLVTAVLAAYALVFLKLRWRGFWLAVFLVTMMIPYESIIIPNYLFVSSLGLKDTIPGLALPFLANGFAIFLLRQAFLTFPMELRDSSRIDGAGDLRFLFSVLLPLSRPTLAALAIYSGLSAWNMYFWPLLITTRASTQTIQIGIGQLQSVDANDPGMVLAGVVLALLPTLALVIFGQKFIVRGLTAGAVK